MPETKPRLLSSEFEFHLPKERVARRPKPHAEQKLLHFDRASHRITHHLFQQLPSLLREGDLLVVNDSKVVPAALYRDDGTNILFLDPVQTHLTDIRAIVPRKIPVGGNIEFPHARFVVKSRDATGVCVGDLVTTKPYDSLLQFLDENGAMPIPPYLKRPSDDRDFEDYQTIFARYDGSVAAPTAGLHFDNPLVDACKQAGVEFRTVTLHVGYGTFKGFKSEFVDEHRADAETYHVPLETLHAVGEARRDGRRVIAVGTTATRTLESIPDQITDFQDIDRDLDGVTELFIYPPFHFRVITGLITNLATPKNPVMSMAAAFVGLDELKTIYQAALDRDYMFYSYGDALLLL